MQRSNEVEELLREVYEAMRRGDANAIAERVVRSNDMVWIGTDPQEWWTGFDRVSRIVRKQFNAAGAFNVVPGDPRGFAVGDVAWVADRATLVRDDGDDLTIRITAVARNEGGRWLLVQVHASVGAANEDAFGQQLPT